MSRTYTTIRNAGMIILCAVFFISPVYAISLQKNRHATDTKRNMPVVSDSVFIQQLIDKTGAGQECLIPEGEYTVAGLNITQPVTLNGQGNVTLRYYNRGASAGKSKPIEQSYVFAIWSDNIEINGLKFENMGSSPSTGIIHLKGDGLKVVNNTFSVSQNCAGIISGAAAKGCVIAGNTFAAGSRKRTFPIIQLGENLNGVKITSNVLESDAPDILSSNLLINFLFIEPKNAVYAHNEFAYTGPWTDEDFGGYEDSETPIAAEVFAEMTKTRINELNPWTRSMGDKSNPETGDGFSAAALGIAGLVQIILVCLSSSLQRWPRLRAIYRRQS